MATIPGRDDHSDLDQPQQWRRKGRRGNFFGYVLRIELIGFPDRSTVGMNVITRVVQLASKLWLSNQKIEIFTKDGVIYKRWSYLQRVWVQSSYNHVCT